VWLVVLSDQLPVKALVGRYPANQLIGRDPRPQRPLVAKGALARGPHAVLIRLSAGYPPLRGRLK
jgi:hypothetical protein